jgi:hypothetical protein
MPVKSLVHGLLLITLFPECLAAGSAREMPSMKPEGVLRAANFGLCVVIVTDRAGDALQNDRPKRESPKARHLTVCAVARITLRTLANQRP